MTGTIHRKNQGKWIRGCILGLMIVVFLLLGCAAARPSGTEFYKGQKVAPNEVLVKFRGTAGPQVINQAATGENVDETEQVGSIQTVRFHSRSKTVETLIRELSARPDVEYVEPNYVVCATFTTPNDPLYANLWGLYNYGQNSLSQTGTSGADISAPEAWDISTGSPDYVVGVVDTGIDYTHLDLAPNVWSAPSQFTVTIGGSSITCPAGSHGFNAQTNTCDPMDDAYHGTHVSGTIGAVGNNGIGVTGVNWNTQLLGLEFLDSTGSGYVSNAVNAIEFAIQLKQIYQSSGGKNGANVRVLSNSWGGSRASQALLDEIKKANSNDILFVAAAGNYGTNNDVTHFYPAYYANPTSGAPYVIAVAATDNKDNLASWSNYGPNSVQLGAPGVDIVSTLSTLLYPSSPYGWLSGTSMATPHVSGAAALVLSACSPMSTAALEADILNNVDSIPSLTGKTVTGGRLNINQAIRACSAVSTTPTTTVVSASQNPSTYGQSVTFTATVSPSPPSGPGITSERVKFFDGTSILGTGTLSGGVATFTTSALSVGTHSITATYGGDRSFGIATPQALQFTVNPGAGGDFTISASPSSQTVNRGSSKSYMVSTTSISGFNGVISFTISGLPSRATASFNPATVTGTGTSILTVQTSSRSPTGTYSLTITGKSGSLIHQAKVTLIITSGSSGFTRGAEASAGENSS